MGKRDPRIDAYIEQSAEFAHPILEHLRAVVHDACPDVEETMKWSFPHFMHHGILCSMAAFKQHCAFGFWRAKQMGLLGDKPMSAMGDFGRITQLGDLPGKVELKRLVKLAMQLNAGPPPVDKTKKAKPAAKPEPVAPEAFVKALVKNRKARTTFENFSPSHRREYIEWILEAKREETIKKRIEASINMLAEG